MPDGQLQQHVLTGPAGNRVARETSLRLVGTHRYSWHGRADRIDYRSTNTRRDLLGVRGKSKQQWQYGRDQTLANEHASIHGSPMQTRSSISDTGVELPWEHLGRAPDVRKAVESYGPHVHKIE